MEIWRVLFEVSTQKSIMFYFLSSAFHNWNYSWDSVEDLRISLPIIKAQEKSCPWRASELALQGYMTGGDCSVEPKPLVPASLHTAYLSWALHRACQAKGNTLLISKGKKLSIPIRNVTVKCPCIHSRRQHFLTSKSLFRTRITI